MFVRPFVLFRECNCKASGTLIIALWHPAPFWLKISLAGVDFFLPSSLAGWIFRQVKQLSLLAGVTAFFGNEVVSFVVLALRIPFCHFSIYFVCWIFFLLFIT